MNLGYYMDQEGRSHGAILTLPAQADGQPVVEITGQGADVARAQYNATSVIEAARRGGSIRVTNGFGDHHGEYVIPPLEVQRMARAVEESVHRSAGKFLVAWQPADPGCPF